MPPFATVSGLGGMWLWNTRSENEVSCENSAGEKSNFHLAMSFREARNDQRRNVALKSI